MLNKKGKLNNLQLIILSILIIIVVVFFIPVPYTTTENYTEIEPYVATEEYQDLEPLTVEECKLDISSNPLEYVTRGINNIDALLDGDVGVLLKTCENVIQYRAVTKTKDVVKYRNVPKQREVTNWKPLFQIFLEKYNNRNKIILY